MQGECEKASLLVYLPKSRAYEGRVKLVWTICRVTPRFNKVSRSHFYAKRSEMKVVYNSYAPKPYCNLFSHGELGSAGLGGLYKEVTEQIGNLFHEKDRISDYICNFVSDIKVLYSELYLIIKILS